MNIYTIGFTKKTAEQFFALLEDNNVKLLYDVRLNNGSQLAGFTKGNDLKYFTKRILAISYEHNVEFSPTKEVLDHYKKGDISWQQYEEKFSELLQKRNMSKYIRENMEEKLDGICLLCSEAEPIQCHRRLVAEYIKQCLPEQEIQIIHL